MKISILMQAYLADYPGSRSDPERKFIRAVYSVIAQTSNDWELVIVSDGCTLTESLYKKYFSTYRNIIFERINKHAGSDMQEEHDRIKYRIPGSPTGRAMELATGDWITYFGSDDFMLRSGIESIKKAINLGLEKTEDLRYIINTSQIEHSSVDLSSYQHLVPIRANLQIDGLTSTWQLTEMEKGSLVLNNARLIHRRGFPEHLWTDEGDYEVPRDTLFFTKIIKEKENLKRTMKISIPYYVRCHSKPGPCHDGVDF